MNLINFAHGSVYTIGAYLGWACITFLYTPLPVTMVIVMLVCGMLGMLIERVGLRPLRGKARIAPLLATIGISFVLDQLVQLVCRPEPRALPSSPSATATRTEVGWLINGRKIFVTGAPALRFLVTIVQLSATEDAPDGEVASAIVRADAPGLRIEPTWGGSLSLRTAGNDDVVYEDVFVPDDWMVERRSIPSRTATPLKPPAGKGAPGPGPWALTIAAVYLCIGEAAVAAACSYANARVPSALAQPIAGQPHIQHWIGQMQVAVDGARAQLYETARLWRDHPPLRDRLGPNIAAAKYLCTNAATSASETGLRVAGGFSLTGALTLERHFRDARAGLFQPPQDDLGSVDKFLIRDEDF
ncbi:acyl-CoA dehydrogenase family protein [Lichenifustis flavocetrariae]|uniref:Acyl-CoA dehydrogenase family protein n=1 Tax=Lichenifustis flavocetrariae TaxID=2949735 RepID=A0AA41Z526_9HYPH|nr:acyl-CoA dehydrogenase family protein [Lichenifustis flavocetrariae]MCW6513207.1 acyl-CoA dehydrogenase family protein [Lichenifustis flavocetrariae]